MYSDIAKREIASILRCDISLLISEVEIDLLQNYFKIDKSILYYLPFLVDTIDTNIVQSWPTFEERKDFIFIGNFLHEPNWNAVQFLKESIWPILQKQLPEVSMQIYGAYPSQKVLQLHSIKDRFLVLGRADNAAAVVRKARVVLAPIRFGAGAKGKLIEAMQCGTPSVTTTVGAESMNGHLPWNGIIADEVQDIANAAIQVYLDVTIWKNAQQNGIEIVNKRYSKPLFAVDCINRILETQKNLEAHRLANFIGAILMHHTLASTKYMSRWIESKNSLK